MVVGYRLVGPASITVNWRLGHIIVTLDLVKVGKCGKGPLQYYYG